MLKIAIAAAILGALSSAHAQPSTYVSQVDAQLVLKHTLALNQKQRLTDFNKWELDSWAAVTASCMHAAKMPDSRLMASITPRRDAVYRIPTDLASTCKLLADYGPDPVCYHYRLTQTPFTVPYPGFSDDALYLEPGIGMPNHNSWQYTSAQCLLNRNIPDSVQTFNGTAFFFLLEVPQNRSVQTANGPEVLPVGIGQIRMDATTLIESPPMYLFAR